MSGEIGGDIGDGGSDLLFFAYSCRGVESVGRCWPCEGMVGVIASGCTHPFIIVSVLFWLCKLCNLR